MKTITILSFLETFSTLYLLSQNRLYFYYILLFHLIFAIIITGIIIVFIPSYYRKSKKHLTFSYLTLLIIFSSFLSIIFVPLITIIGLRFQKEEIDLELKEISVDYVIQSYPSVYRQFREGSLANIHKDKLSSADHKLKAIYLLSQLNNRVSITILKKLLLDKDEEVRLYSHNILSKFEKKITDEIAKITNLLEKKPYAELHQQLAFLYWELIFLGLASDDMEKFFIEKIIYHGTLVLKYKENKNIYYLLGRIYMLNKQIDKAHSAFKNALRLGMSREKVIPYLAEIFFHKKDFKTLKNILAFNQHILTVDSKFAKIIKIWL